MASVFCIIQDKLLPKVIPSLNRHFSLPVDYEEAQMRIINMPAPLIGAAFALIAAAIHWYFDLGETMRFSWPWLGISVGLTGFFLMTGSTCLFKREGLAVMPAAKTSHLTTSGPYRFSRHPMYLGMVLISLGLSVYIGTTPFYLSTIGYFAILNFVFCRYEEDKLTEAFGQEYLLYMNRVRRWL